METTVAKVDDDGVKYNRFNERLIPCKNECGRLTTMLGTQLCDYCWEDQRGDGNLSFEEWFEQSDEDPEYISISRTAWYASKDND